MTIEELVKKYKSELKISQNKKATVSEIVKRVNSLIDAESKKPISDENKKRILIELRKEALLESQICFAHDNKEHLELLNKAIATLGGKK